MELISMVEFVLQQEKCLENILTEKLPVIKLASSYDKIVNYANFLKQPLTLGMFVPCYENGNVLKESILGREPYSNDEEDFKRWERDYKKYNEAKEKVLFKDVKIGSYRNDMFHFTGLGKSYLIINGFIYDDNQNSSPQKTEDKIEDLLQWNENLGLTESAIKQIGLNP